MSTKIRLKQIDEIELAAFFEQFIEDRDKDFLPFLIITGDLPEINPVGPNEIISHDVVFPNELDLIPNVVLSLSSASGTDIVGYHLSNISISGFTILFTSPIPAGVYKYTYIATTGDGEVNLLI